MNDKLNPLRILPVAALEYAPVVVWYKRLRWRRWVMGLSVVIALTIAGTYFEPSWVDAVRFHYLYARCAHFQLPSETVVYDEDPASSVIGKPGYLSDAASPQFRNPASVGITDPSCFTSLAHFCDIMPIYLKGFTHIRTVTNCLFMHELIAGGHRRLLILHYTENGVTADKNDLTIPTFYEYYLFDPDVLKTSRGYTFWVNREEYLAAAPFFPLDPTPTTTKGTIYYAPTRRPMKFYTGQFDPAVPDRFTIDYEMDGVRHRLIGRLDLDGQSISISE